MLLAGAAAHGQTNTFPSSGNVGIGTTSPGDLLSVSGGNIALGSLACLKSTGLYVQSPDVSGNGYVLILTGLNMVTTEAAAEFVTNPQYLAQVLKLAGARDASELLRGGYRLTSVTPIDQFRYAAHVEIVARLVK